MDVCTLSNCFQVTQLHSRRSPPQQVKACLVAVAVGMAVEEAVDKVPATHPPVLHTHFQRKTIQENLNLVLSSCYLPKLMLMQNYCIAMHV